MPWSMETEWEVFLETFRIPEMYLLILDDIFKAYDISKTVNEIPFSC